MPNNGFTERIIRTLGKKVRPGALFTTLEMVDWLSTDGDPLTRDQINSSLARLNTYGLVHRETVGVYSYTPPQTPVRPVKSKDVTDKKNAAAAAARPESERTGPAAGVAPLAIASANTGKPAVAESVKDTVTNHQDTLNALAASPDSGKPSGPVLPKVRSESAPTPTGGGPRKPGDVFLMTYLASLNGSGAFLAQSDDDGRVYRVSEVTT